jgi:ribosomal protein L37AE/L43A
MSEVYARPEPSLIPIPRPFCPTCQRRMTLTRIGSGCDGPDLRIFECTNCGHVYRVPTDDPMKPASSGRTGTARKRPQHGGAYWAAIHRPRRLLL